MLRCIFLGHILDLFIEILKILRPEITKLLFSGITYNLSLSLSLFKHPRNNFFFFFFHPASSNNAREPSVTNMKTLHFPFKRVYIKNVDIHCSSCFKTISIICVK